MSIFAEYAGPGTPRGFYSPDDWGKIQNPDWASETGHPTRGFYTPDDWGKIQNTGWARTQAEYDQFVAQAKRRADAVAKRATGIGQARYDDFLAEAQLRQDSRAAAMQQAQQHVPVSYAGSVVGGTAPIFSLAGLSGQTSGGTAGLSHMAGGGPVTAPPYAQNVGIGALPRPPSWPGIHGLFVAQFPASYYR